MANQSFDPYYKWLGIPPAEQPPNYYRLLGVNLFEPDLDAIHAAADARMSHLRSFQSGPHSALSQKLLNEVSQARVTLGVPERKGAYDRWLEETIAGRQAAFGGPVSQTPAEGLHAPLVKRPAPRRKRSSSMVPMVVAAVFAAMVLLGALYVLPGLSGGNREAPVLQVQWTLEQRSDATLSVDGKTVIIPSTDPFQFTLTPGTHTIVLTRDGYRPYEKSLKLEPGMTVILRPAWIADDRR